MSCGSKTCMRDEFRRRKARLDEVQADQQRAHTIELHALNARHTEAESALRAHAQGEKRQMANDMQDEVATLLAAHDDNLHTAHADRQSLLGQLAAYGAHVQHLTQQLAQSLTPPWTTASHAFGLRRDTGSSVTHANSFASGLGDSSASVPECMPLSMMPDVPPMRTQAGSVRPISAFVFDIRTSGRQHRAVQTTPLEGVRLGRHEVFGPDSLNAQFFATKRRRKLFHTLFAFDNYDQARVFFRTVFADIDPDACEKGCGTVTNFEGWLLTLWRMRWRESQSLMAATMGVTDTVISHIVNRWIPLCGRAGRSFVWLPDADYLLGCVPDESRACGMGDVGLYGDCSDFLTETVRLLIELRNMQYLGKSQHSGAMGAAWCSALGFVAVASDLTLGKTSEYELGKFLAPSLEGVPSHVRLCYDKGLPSLRPHLPNMNDVVLPCFLSKEHNHRYTVAQASRNRAVAQSRYVIEVVFKRVKQWRMLSPIVPREDFHHLNDVWWWALGFSNAMHKPMRAPGTSATTAPLRQEDVAVVQSYEGEDVDQSLARALLDDDDE